MLPAIRQFQQFIKTLYHFDKSSFDLLLSLLSVHVMRGCFFLNMNWISPQQIGKKNIDCEWYYTNEMMLAYKSIHIQLWMGKLDTYY